MNLAGYTLLDVISAVDHTVIAKAQATDGEIVVLKYQDTDQPSLELTARWQHEHQVLATIDSPSIIKTYGIRQVDTRLILVLEYFTSTNLKQLISEHELDLSAGLGIAIQLAAALGEVHRHQVIHADISSKNVLIHRASRQIKLCDFGLSTRLEHESRRDRETFAHGTLEYMAPEQTGRTNLDVDYRSDFYSMGVVLYELFAGHLPFQSPDPMSLLHAQIAIMPTPLHQAHPDIPEPLSDVVQKLLAKDPADRYQSSRGLQCDLELCSRQWQQRRQIAPFELAEGDVPERFCVTQKLYGRAREQGAILSAFDRVRSGRAELLLISGASGVGKSVLVHSLCQPVLASRGYFIRGKCDQYLRNQPFSALVQAFASLVRQLLGEDAEHRRFWKSELQRSLGANAAAITQIIPNLTQLIGEPSPLQPLPAAERENRFHIAFGQFVKALATGGHQLALFLDDLQWVDLPTVRLLEQLLTHQEDCCLLILGAYRHQEVDETHPLTQVIKAVETSRGGVQHLHLDNLDLANVTPFLVDTLRRSPAEVAPLAALCIEKTGGNPFFLKQFLLSLQGEGAIHYDRQGGGWRWDMTQIEQGSMTDNVVDLVVEKLRLLKPATQSLVALAAHFGNHFELRQLMVAARQDSTSTSALLWPALQLGLVVPMNEDYKFSHTPQLLEGARFRFLHDRVQQAAYGLTPEAELKAMQLSTGRILLADTTEATLDERLFMILDQLNSAVELITDRDERAHLRSLNLRGGLLAKAASAYPAAADLLRQAKALLPEHAWLEQPQETLSVYKELAEAHYLGGQFQAAEELYSEGISAAPDAIAKVTLCLVQVDQFHIQGRFPESLPVLLQALGLLGESFPASEAEASQQFPVEFGVTEALLAHSMDGALPTPIEMTRPEHLLQMRIYFALSFASYQTGQFALFFVDACKMVQATVRNGECDLSSIAYVAYMSAMSVMGKPYPSCYQMGLRARTLAEQREAKYFRVTIYQYFSSFYQHWCEPLEACFPYLERGLDWGREGINPLSAGYCALMLAVNQFIKGMRLDALESLCAQGLGFLQKSHQPATESMLRLGVFLPVLALQGRTQSTFSLDPAGQTASDYFKGDFETPSIQLALHSTATLRHAYLFAEAEQWQAASHKLGIVGMCLPDSPALVEATFYVALGLLNPNTADPSDPADNLLRAGQFADKFKTWATDCEANFKHKHLLICAEMARVRGEEKAAMALYSEAIDAARRAEFPVCEALANELYAGFWSAHQQKQLARVFIQEAHYLYGRWGAEAKCAWLVQRWPQVHFEISEGRRGSADRTSSYPMLSGRTDSLDLHSLFKASQLLAQEISLESLLPKMMGVLLENAGAEQGALLLHEDGRLILEVVGTMTANQTAACQRIQFDLDQASDASSPRVPHAVVSHVRATGEILVLNSPAQDLRFSGDDYLTRRQPKSVLCAPIVAQGKQVALVYLENNLLENAFTLKQQKTLELLSTQAAISLVNARLYDSLEEKVAKRTEHLEKMNAVVASINAELAKSQEKISQLMAESPDLLEDLEAWVKRMADSLSELAPACRISALAFEGSRVVFYGPAMASLPSLGALSQMKTTTFLPEGRVLIPARGPSGDLVGVVTVEGGTLAEEGPLQRLMEGFAHQFGAAVEMLHIRTRLHAVEATQAKTLEEFHAKGIPTLQVCHTCGRCYDHSQTVCIDDGGRLDIPRALPYRFLGRYRFLRCLGTGGMGAVYAAEDEQLHRLAAIKLIRPELVSETALRLRFEREAQAIAKVHHPGVVTLYDSGSTGDGQLYLIMEHLRGLDVASALRRFGRATPAQAARFLRQGAAALQAAHEARVIHRDLKPQNLFLVPHATEGFQLKVLDFGVAKHTDSNINLTHTGHMMGTPQYMAPEQMSGGETDERTDLYAFAAVIFEVLTGDPVVAASRDSNGLRSKWEPSLCPLSSLLPELPPEVDEMFAQALAQSIEDRPLHLVDWAEHLAGRLEPLPGSGGWPEAIPFTSETTLSRTQVPTRGSQTRLHGENTATETTRPSIQATRPKSIP